MVEASDRVRGILLGLCAGDRNGGPIQMALELAESLRSLGRFNADDVLRCYVGWFRQEGTDTLERPLLKEICAYRRSRSF